MVRMNGKGATRLDAADEQAAQHPVRKAILAADAARQAGGSESRACR